MSLSVTTKGGSAWHQQQWEERRARDDAERAARYRANPELYRERRRLAGVPQVPRLAVQEAADRAERKSAGVFEPGKAEIAEMRSAHYLSEITGFCRNFRGQRDEIKEALNHAFMTQGIGLKVIRWQWGRQ